MKSNRVWKRVLALVLCIAMLSGDATAISAETLNNAIESTEITESTEVTDGTQSLESTEGTESTESTESTEGTESTEDIESTEGTEAIESTEDTESTEEAESTEETEQIEILEDEVPLAALFSLESENYAAQRSSKCLIGLKGTSNNSDAIVKDSTYAEVISQNKPQSNNGNYSYYTTGTNVKTDRYYVNVVVEYADEVVARSPESNNPYAYLRYKDVATQTFAVNPADGYVVSDVSLYVTESQQGNSTTTSTKATLNEDGTYSCTLQKLNSTDWNKKNYVNELRIILTDAEEETGETADFKANLFKYNKDAINNASKAVDSSNYLSIGTSDAEWNKNHYEGVYQNLAGNALNKGMIVFPDYATTDFFTANAKETDRTDFYTVVEEEKTSYFNVTFPFKKSGNAYEYDSSKQSATLNTENGEISIGSSNGGFWPFGVNSYYFGMNFATDFYMTNDGKIDGEDIVFEFSGDDDVWVYIDGKLILDLGGIHGAVGGSINFNTGDVRFYDAGTDSSQVGVIRESSKADYITDITESDGNIVAASYNFYENEVNGLTRDGLLDGDAHELQVYYMERGAGKSNCKIKFNLPQTPQQNVLKVTNKVENTLNGEKVEDDTTFSYIVKKDGNVLADAEFTHKAADGTATVQTTDSEGQLTLKDGESAVFTSPEAGVYTVTEILENGYETSYEARKNETQTSEAGPIEKSSEAATLEATHTIVTEMNKAGDLYQIDFLNVASETEYSFSSDKTATLVNWDDRTYDITLSASSTTEYTTGGDTTVTVTKPAVDVVLVLDVSGSMNDGTCLTDLKTAASNFVQGLYKNADENSRIAIVTFNTSATKAQGLTTLTEDNVSTIKRKINAITADGGTDQSKGLSVANEMLKNSTSGNQKYVILFTDGQPDTKGGTSSDETPIADAAYDCATEIKAYATLYTVRLGAISGGSVSYCKTGTTHMEYYQDWFGWWYQEEVPDYKYNNRTYVQWLTDLATDGSHALSVSKSSQLDTIFEQIKNEVTTPTETVSVPLTGATVTDTIDARFELTDGEKERLEADGAVITTKNGTTTITWSNQTLQAETKSEDGVATPGWCKIIHIKAKEDYIGGNAVATNVNPGSYVEINGEKTEFDQPTVNVKAELEVGNHLEEIFLGETVPTEEKILQNLANVDNLTGKYGVDESRFALTWYEDQALTSKISVSDMAEVKPDVDGAQYYLKVTYDAGTPTEDSNKNTLADGVAKFNGTPETAYQVDAVNKEDSSLNYGIYTIKVIDGKIVITKEIPEGSYKKNQGDPIFTFKITNTDTKKVYYRTLRFKDEGTTVLTATVEHLEKGHYLVEELDTIRYDMTGLFINTDVTDSDATNCAYKTGDVNATFAIGYTQAKDAGAGYETAKAEQATGQIGNITFTNEKKDESRELTDTDVVKNSFAVGAKTSATKDADNNR